VTLTHSALEAGEQEAAEGRNERDEDRDDEEVQLELAGDESDRLHAQRGHPADRLQVFLVEGALGQAVRCVVKRQESDTVCDLHEPWQVDQVSHHNREEEEARDGSCGESLESGLRLEHQHGRPEREKVTREVVNRVVHRHAAHGVEEPNAALPEGKKETLAAGDDQNGAKQGPAEHTELVAVKALLKRDDEEDHTKSEQHEHGQAVILVAEGVDKGARLGGQA